MRNPWRSITIAAWLALAGLVPAGQVVADATPTETEMARDEGSRIGAMGRLAIAQRHRGAFVAEHGGPDSDWNVVLPARAQPYSLDELRDAVPEAFDELPGAVLLRYHIVVAEGARLDIDGPLELRLRSDAHDYVSIASYGGTIDIGGSGPVSISSWDPKAGAPDDDLADGRAFVLTRGGRMDITNSSLSQLGFGTGMTSGAAWKGLPGEPSRGDVRGTRFVGNQFGAYTFESVGMHWTDNVFADNVIYGFDPHDFSNDFVVTGNEAYGNGRHGIIFSRGCSGNLIAGNRSYDNGWHGIVLDDGKIADDGDPRHAFAVPSNDNVIRDNEVWGNEVGIALEGGTRNVVSGNLVRDNRFGIRLKDAASGNVVSDNDIRASEVFGIYVYVGSNANRLSRNTVTEGQHGILIKDSRDNEVASSMISGIDGHGVGLVGDATGTVIHANTIAGQGSSAIDVLRHTGGTLDIGMNSTSDWRITPGFRPLKAVVDFVRHQPFIVIWLVVIGVPLVASASIGWRRRRTKRLSFVPELAR